MDIAGRSAICLFGCFFVCLFGGKWRKRGFVIKGRRGEAIGRIEWRANCGRDVKYERRMLPKRGHSNMFLFFPNIYTLHCNSEVTKLFHLFFPKPRVIIS